MQLLLRSFIALAFAFLAGHAAAQTYPAKPIRAITPSAAGTGPDVIVRAVAGGLSKLLGQPVVVENRPGAAGIIGMDQCAKAAPDGYTLCISHSQPVTFVPHAYLKLPFEPLRDLSMIANLGYFMGGIVVNPSVPANSVSELIALERAKPESIAWGSFGSGSIPHMYLEWFNSQYGTHFRHIPYKSVVDAMQAVMNGEVQATINTANVIAPQIKAGRLKPIAQLGTHRSPMLPGVVPFTEQGYSLDMVGWEGIFGPARIPRDIVLKLNGETNRMLGDRELVEKVLAPVSLVPTPGTPEEFAEFVKKDLELNGRLSKIANIKPE
jgi:tripartite-type tricarboxylate transporter receptor subunit TctC